jgi:hypothetical protein
MNQKVAVTAAAFLAMVALSVENAQARPAWFGPGSGPVSPYKNFKGFAQLPRQPGSAARTYRPAPASNLGHCVPNVGLVGANGVCPD